MRAEYVYGPADDASIRRRSRCLWLKTSYARADDASIAEQNALSRRWKTTISMWWQLHLQNCLMNALANQQSEPFHPTMPPP